MRKQPEQRPRRSASPAAGGLRLARAQPARGWAAEPLERLTVLGAAGAAVAVTDSRGREYFRAKLQTERPKGRPKSSLPEVSFAVGGSLGAHTVKVLNARGRVTAKLSFEVDARTKLEDSGGAFKELFGILDKTLRIYSPDGCGSMRWRGRTYRYFVHWILDHCHTAKGMQYFAAHAGGLVDLLRDAQREDGMIWSNAQEDPGPGYFDSAYGPYGYARRDRGALFVRQPVENHCEYNFVDTLHLAWKGSGDDRWMAKNLAAALRALDYGMTDRARWSSRFGLLKRGYTIDSWDFQVEDPYTVPFPLATSQLIDPDRTRFGVFFGDNHGYAYACEQLAEMLAHAGRGREAAKCRRRAKEIRRRLDRIAWNGRFFLHRVEEDSRARRDLGVDEKSQIAMSNAYALNRSIPHAQCVAIVRTYQDLRRRLPPGSPGEFYSIYPPFERGFGKDSGRWQYMNAGVHGHAAGELARGAFEHGFEEYGADILRRVRELGRRHGGIVRFAYTGACEPPPPKQVFTPLDISAQANMDFRFEGAPGVPGWMAEKDGNDLRNMPTGRQTLAGVPFSVPDPEQNERRGALAVGHRNRFAPRVEMPVGAKAGAVYLLHTSASVGPSSVAGAVTFCYPDGSVHSTYILRDKHLTGWWFPHLKTEHSGVAWRGPNPRSSDVGVCWAALPNPHPEKTIRSLIFSAAVEGAMYAVLGVTLADRMPHVPPKAVSFGGPDNWSGGTCLLALMQGLAGIADAGTAYARVRLSPRWPAAGVPQAAVTARYGASQGYVAYRYRHDAKARVIELEVTGGGDGCELRVLLPAGAKRVAEATMDGRAMRARLEKVEKSVYAVLKVGLAKPTTVCVKYAK